MEDRTQSQKRERILRELKQKIRDPDYLQLAVQRLAGKLAKEFYQRTQRGSTN